MRLIRQWFDTSQPDGQLAARYCTLVVWLIGSLYLMNYEWSKKPFEFIIFVSTPFIWAMVIALPVIARNAFRNGAYLAGIVITFAAIVGITYTLTSTISRQSIMRDSNVIGSDFNDRERNRLQRSLAQNEKMLNEELQLKKNKCDRNPKFDCNEINRSLQVYESAVIGDKAELRRLGLPTTPLAGENRFAEILAYVREIDIVTAKAIVSAIFPWFFGLLCEISAIGLAMYGWHNYGMLKLEYHTGQLSDSSFKIEVLRHQLAIAKRENKAVDVRVIAKQLTDAKEQLKKELDKNG